MKKTLLLIAMMLCCATAILAQNNRISYQAVVRDAQNRLVANKTVTVTVNIYNGTETTAAYTETQTATTNLNGLVSLQIGPDGDNAAWSNIQWKNASIKTTVTLDGTSLGTLEMPLTAVPYALYADYADSVNLNVIANYLASHNIPDGAGMNVQSDWNQTDTHADDYIKNKPDLATVATTGNYNDLSNTPNLATVATTGSYNDLSNTPNLATVATTGNYNDLSNKPTIPAAQVNADWNASSGVAQILNKPTLATVATTGNYNDLSNTPNLATVATTGSYNDLSNTPNLATVATTGSYNDLSNTPNLATVATTGNYNDLNNKPNIKDTIGGYLDTCTVVANMKTDLTKLQNGIKKAALCDSVADCVNSRINSSLSTALSNYATKAKVKQDSIDICALIATSSAGSGTLNTNNTNALDVESSETISGEVKLHKISKTGSYGDLNNRPSIKDTIGGYLDTCTVVTTMQTDINGLRTNVTKLQNGIKKAALCDSVADCVNSRISTALSNYATKAKVKQDSIDICALIPTTVAELTDASDYVTTTYLGNQNYVTTTYLNNQHYVSDAGCPTVDICALVAEVATLRTDMRKSIDSLKKTIDTLKNVIDSLEGVINDFSGDIPPTTDVPDGAIDGRFTINGDQAKVYFSQGNLQATYDGSAWSWAFADNQYDYIGNAEGNTKVTDSSPFVSGYSGSSTTVDLFGWVGASSNWNTNTGVNMYGITSSTATANKDGYGNQRDDALNSDWGTLAITNGGNTANSGWRTLTYDEWEWILGPSSNPNPGTNCRTSSTVGGTENARYAKATVDGKAGLIIFPDSYTHPNDVTAPTSININAATVAFTVNTYDATAWEKMEEAGAVFLPVAGYRYGTSVNYVGSRGGYWTSSPYNKNTVNGNNDNRKAYYLRIHSSNNNNFVDLYNNDRCNGYSVRLVKGANN